MAEIDIEMDIHIKKAVEILDKNEWTNIGEFLQPHGEEQITLVHISAYRGDLEKLKHAFRYGLDLWARDKFGRGALHYAAAQGHVDVVRWLLEDANADGGPNETESSAKAQLSLKDSSGKTAMDLAEKGKHSDVVKLLMKIRIKEIALAGNLDVEFLVNKGANVNSQTEDDTTPLHLAAYNRKLDVVESLLNEGANVNSQTEDGIAPLHVAAQIGELDVVESLLDKGANVNSQTKDGATPLHFAAYNGKLDVVKSLVKKEASVNSQTKDGKTPLHLAALNGKLDVVEFLVKKGANVNSQTEDDSTPLHFAAYNGKLDVVKSLVNKEASVNSQTKDGKTPLHLAAYNGKLDVVEFLVKKRANVNSQTEDDSTPLHLAADNGKLDVVEFLVKEGANVNSQTKDGATPLHLAAYNGKLDIVESLLDQGANLNSQTEDGIAPLHVAARNGQLDVVESLLNKGASVNSQTKDGRTPLHLAAYNGKLNVVESLLKEGASVNSQTKDGRTPLHLAADNGKLNVVESLLEEGASVNSQTKDGRTPLHFAAYNGKLDVVESLVNKEASVNSQTKDGKTPLHLAAYNGKLNVVEPLLKNGASVNSQTKDDSTPLHFAAYNGKLDVVKSLVKKEASVNSQTKNGATPLHLAAYNGKLDVVESLLSNGASVNSQTKDGLTPLHFAALNGKLDVVQFLLNKKADPAPSTEYLENKKNVDGLDAEDKLGKRALHYAAEEGHLEIVKYLVERLGAVTGEISEGKLSQLLLRDSFDMSPLQYAAKQGHLDVVKYLLKDLDTDLGERSTESLAQLSLKDSEGRTALHLAVKGLHVTVVMLLVRKGANVNAKDEHGVSPLLMAHSLIYRNDDVNRNNEDLISRYEEIVDFLVTQRASVDSCDPKPGWTALHYAARLNSQRATQLLSKYDSNLVLNPGRKDKTEDTPVHVAASYTSNEALCILLESLDSSEMDSPNSNGLTPLHAAASACNFEGLRLLINKGGSLAKKNNVGRTPIDVLSERKDSGVVVTFLTGILDTKISSYGEDGSDAVRKHSGRAMLDFNVLRPENEDLQMAVVSAMIEILPREDQILILEHPLVNTYIILKWSRISCFFGICLFIRFLFAVCLSAYAICLQEDSVALIMRWIMFLFAVILFGYKTLQFFTEPKRYFKKFENCLYPLCLIISMVVAVHEFMSNVMAWWIPYTLSVIVPIVWIHTMLLAGQLSMGGLMFNTLVFSTALTNFLKVFLIGFLSIIIGFATSFTVLWHRNDQFDNPLKAFLKSVLIMTGDTDFGDLWSNDTKSIIHNLNATESERTLGPIISGSVVLVFVILATVVLMNLMIGLAVSDVQTLINQGDFSRLLKQAEFIAEFEQMAIARIFQYHLMPERLKGMLESISAPPSYSLKFSSKNTSHVPEKLIKNIYSHIIGLEKPKYGSF